MLMAQLLDGIARELGDHGITVNAYAAGAVETRLRQTKPIPLVIKDDYIRRLRDPFVGAPSMISFKLMIQVPEARLVPAIYDFAQL
jgi:NAD(P)-dependent dehydrogenase (short-subunit alcohol dehydrogenase family)